MRTMDTDFSRGCSPKMMTTDCLLEKVQEIYNHLRKNPETSTMEGRSWASRYLVTLQEELTKRAS